MRELDRRIHRFRKMDGLPGQPGNDALARRSAVALAVRF
jgi:hypothetical protein